jgi:hypothetical protein
MSDCSSVVARDGNNKVKVSITDRLFEIKNVYISYKFKQNVALLWLFEGIKTRGNDELL